MHGVLSLLQEPRTGRAEQASREPDPIAQGAQRIAMDAFGLKFDSPEGWPEREQEVTRELITELREYANADPENRSVEVRDLDIILRIGDRAWSWAAWYDDSAWLGFAQLRRRVEIQVDDLTPERVGAVRWLFTSRHHRVGLIFDDIDPRRRTRELVRAQLARLEARAVELDRRRLRSA